MRADSDKLKTRIWAEEPQPDNPFAAARCYLSGYDVHGELVGGVGWVEYLYLLFHLELPEPRQARLLELLAVALANPGIRDLGVRAAMNAGAGGSTRASALMAALAVGAGGLGGGREIVICHRYWQLAGRDLDRWRELIQGAPPDTDSPWPALEHVPGFDPHGVSCPPPVMETLHKLARVWGEGHLHWLATNRDALEAAVGYPLAMSGVAAAALVDLGFDEGQAEMLYLLLRLPGAAAHALEQEQQGWRGYPFFTTDLAPMDRAEYQRHRTEWERDEGK